MVLLCYQNVTVNIVFFLQYVGTDVDDVLKQLTEVKHYCKASRGQHIHDILDHINVALRVSCVMLHSEYCEFLTSAIYVLHCLAGLAYCSAVMLHFVFVSL